MKRIHIPETASYRRAFDAVNAMMDVKHMTNGVEVPSVELGVPGDQGLVIVAVGVCAHTIIASIGNA
jgi:hypothetical protein